MVTNWLKFTFADNRFVRKRDKECRLLHSKFQHIEEEGIEAMVCALLLYSL